MSDVTASLQKSSNAVLANFDAYAIAGNEDQKTKAAFFNSVGEFNKQLLLAYASDNAVIANKFADKTSDALTNAGNKLQKESDRLRSSDNVLEFITQSNIASSSNLASLSAAAETASYDIVVVNSGLALAKVNADIAKYNDTDTKFPPNTGVIFAPKVER